MTRWFFLFRWSNGKVSHQALVLFFFFAPRHSSSLRLFFSSLFYFVVAELADMMVKFFGWFDFFFSLYLKSLMFTAKKWAFLLLLHSIYSEKIFLCAEWKIKCRSKLTRRKSGMCAITTTTIDIERQSNRNKKKMAGKTKLLPFWGILSFSGGLLDFIAELFTCVYVTWCCRFWARAEYESVEGIKWLTKRILHGMFYIFNSFFFFSYFFCCFSRQLMHFWDSSPFWSCERCEKIDRFVCRDMNVLWRKV